MTRPRSRFPYLGTLVLVAVVAIIAWVVVTNPEAIGAGRAAVGRPGTVEGAGSSATAPEKADPASTKGAPATTTTRARPQKVDPETGLAWIDAADLPSQGRAVLALIDKGGPYPYDQDGQTFRNAERLLPSKVSGFYTEYTVKLPGSSDRGPVRIIMGGKGQWFFWTTDHYASFSRIRR